MHGHRSCLNLVCKRGQRTISLNKYRLQDHQKNLVAFHSQITETFGSQVTPVYDDCAFRHIKMNTNISLDLCLTRQITRVMPKSQ